MGGVFGEGPLQKGTELLSVVKDLEEWWMQRNVFLNTDKVTKVSAEWWEEFK